MDEFNKIRKEFHVRQKSIYQIAKEFHRSWDTVKQIVSMPDHKVQLRGTRPGRMAAVITPEVENRIIQFLDFEKIHKVHRKQRFTSSYIFKKLKDEENFKGSSRSIRTIVSKLRKERNESTKGSHLELDFEFGKYLQVDHGPAEVSISGNRINGYLFVASIPGSCLRYCQFYLTKAQEAWGHFHELCFSFFGGTLENCIYDNDCKSSHPYVLILSKFSRYPIHEFFEQVFTT
jgi:hypothetical protein